MIVKIQRVFLLQDFTCNKCKQFLTLEEKPFYLKYSQWVKCHFMNVLSGHEHYTPGTNIYFVTNVYIDTDTVRMPDTIREDKIILVVNIMRKWKGNCL